MIDLSGYDFTDNYVESRLQEIQTMLRSQTEEKHQFLVIHHSLTVGMNAHISKSVEMKVLEKTISSIKFEGTEKHTIFILTLIKKKKSIRVFMILVDFLLDKI